MEVKDMDPRDLKAVAQGRPRKVKSVWPTFSMISFIAMMLGVFLFWNVAMSGLALTVVGLAGVILGTYLANKHAKAEWTEFMDEVMKTGNLPPYPESKNETTHDKPRMSD